VALANKLARICWAIMTTGEGFRVDTYVKAEANPRFQAVSKQEFVGSSLASTKT